MLDIVLLHAIAPDFLASELAANKVKESIKNAFEAKVFDQEAGVWKNIVLRSIDVISEEGLSYRQFTLMKRWRLDYISLGTDPPQPIAPE